MKRYLFLLSTLLCTFAAFSQSAASRISAAFQQFEADSQLRSAISSLYVTNAKTGEVVFEKNAKIGLATASTMKVITAAGAYELLGRDFRYATQFGYTGKIDKKKLYGDFYIKSSGDPTLGSWRWKETTDSAFFRKISNVVQKLQISDYAGIDINNKGWQEETIPDGWIWQDIGNYYGAGATGFNWHENQFDILLKSGGNIGDPVKVAQTKPQLYSKVLRSVATSAAKGTGDNTYVYFPFDVSNGVIRGTIPVNETTFTISAATPNPAYEFTTRLQLEELPKLKIGSIHYEGPKPDTTILFTHVSPSIDSIIYWFLKRSINLYGEALTKTIAYQKTGSGATNAGTNIIRNFWKSKGIDPVELKMEDGSGLSPLNRVTTHAQVQVLQYAKMQPWFSGYFNGFPEYNSMKMKSGTINGVKGFCGYQTAKDGTEYIFSFLVNNYNGSASRLVNKMYKVLDELK
ncbi:MAG: D-alanyl-D-alanine carboxypeptidase [Flaviaesturariibacter sp.]|nr:D-alanyl-D-alanine carboxypeptidase [Flaviaesturariibacter sp.]